MKFQLSSSTHKQRYRSRPVVESHLTLQSQVAVACDPNEIAAILQRWVGENFDFRSCFVFYHEPITDQYLAGLGPTGDAVSDLGFSNDSSLLKLLAGKKVWYYQPTVGDMPDEL